MEHNSRSNTLRWLVGTLGDSVLVPISNDLANVIDIGAANSFIWPTPLLAPPSLPVDVDMIQLDSDDDVAPDGPTHPYQLKLQLEFLLQMTEEITEKQQIITHWMGIMYDHAYAKPARDDAVNMCHEYAKLDVTISNHINDNINGVAVTIRQFKRVDSKLENMKSEFKVLEDNVKPFLPKDEELARDLQQIHTLVDPNCPLAKRLRTTV